VCSLCPPSPTASQGERGGHDESKRETGSAAKKNADLEWKVSEELVGVRLGSADDAADNYPDHR